MNPFDGDPGGAPPAPQWSGAYGGDKDSIDDRDFADRRDRRESPQMASRDDEYEPAPPPETRRNDRPARNDYGTSSVETAELAPAGATPLPPPVDARSNPPPAPRTGSGPAYEPAPAPTSTGDRTLTTNRNRVAEPAPPPPPAGKPAQRTMTHTVAQGEELSDIADQYGVREVEIIALNGMKPPYTLKGGQALKVPARDTGAAVAPKSGDYVQAGERAIVPSPKPNLGGQALAEAEPARKPETASAAEGPTFDWPVSGKVISGFGTGSDGLYNEGINIAVASGTPVRASASGTVRYAGNELRGYGNLVLIEHSGGYVTAYAHNDVLTVKRGQEIKRGDVIARSGQTGNVKSPQLHFEIRKGTQSLDPRKHLVAMN
jgi:murein DD-endopeptidase MepM/ murein hydrolase activator NlpD